MCLLVAEDVPLLGRIRVVGVAVAVHVEHEHLDMAAVAEVAVHPPGGASAEVYGVNVRQGN